ncbi:MAG: PLP-dependent aminotransferase family protein, partial [Oscillospiraceae bacterium]|nr:PLP-dependent aminotransferase family protein [Oscillospiraceae bacterium]
MSKTTNIKQDIIDMIRLGVISPGEKMPSIRSLAKKYGVSITPVNDAYNALIAMQLVESRPQSGYYVNSSVDKLQEVLDTRLHIGLNKSEHYSMVDDFLSGYSEIALNSNNDIHFSFGSTSASSLLYPELHFNNCLLQAVRASDTGGNYQVRLHDELNFKKNIMKWMLSCQCKNSIEDISVVRSVSEGVMLGIRACSDRDSLIAIESPGHVGFYFIAKFLGREILSVPSHPVTGLDVDAFEAYLRQGIRPGCLVLSSTFSNPTGASMPDENKLRLTQLCAMYSVPIIEDDILGELYFTKTRPRPLKSFDNDNVIYVSGFGKCLNPTARMGYVSAGKFKDEFAFQKHLSTAYVYPFLQHAMSDFLESGIAYRDVNFFRKWLKRTLDTYRAVILEFFPSGTDVTSPNGGPYLWVTLPDGISSNALCDAAKKIGITIAPGRLFNTTQELDSCFRFNCVALSFGSDAL